MYVRVYWYLGTWYHIPGTTYLGNRLIPGTAAAFQVFWLVICSNSNEEQAFRRDRS